MTQINVVYTARNGCLTSKHFKTMETAKTWLDRVGAKDIRFFEDVETENGWKRVWL